MSKDEEKVAFDKVKMSYSRKISRQMITNSKITEGYSNDDFMRDMLSRRIESYFYANSQIKRELKYYTEKPTFLDWLFGKRKTVYFELDIQDILLSPPEIKEGACRIYVIKEKIYNT